MPSSVDSLTKWSRANFWSTGLRTSEILQSICAVTSPMNCFLYGFAKGSILGMPKKGRAMRFCFVSDLLSVMAHLLSAYSELDLIYLLIYAACGLEFLRRSLLCDPALVKDHHLVRLGQGRYPV